MATHRNGIRLSCPTPRGVRPRRLEADFSGGQETSLAGTPLLVLAARKYGLIERIAACITDHRDPRLIVHPVEQLVAQRIYGIALGFADINDHDELRKDLGVALSMGRVEPGRGDCEALAGKSTLNRFELAAGDLSDERKFTIDFERLHDVYLDVFLAVEKDRAGKADPELLVLDIDATDIELHGQQECRHYHGYYRTHCFLQVVVYCNRFPVLVRLRESGTSPASNIGPDIERLLDRLRAALPKTRLLLRGDSGFRTEELMALCESRENVDFMFGLAKNTRLEAHIRAKMAEVCHTARSCKRSVRRFHSFPYQTQRSWARPRFVVAKVEALYERFGRPVKPNPRFVVTSLSEDACSAEAMYDRIYVKRGDAENRIKEFKLDLEGNRCSSNQFGANTFRVMKAGFAQQTLEIMRCAFKNTPFENARLQTLRQKFLQIGAQVSVSARRIYFRMAAAHPYQGAYQIAWQRLVES